MAESNIDTAELTFHVNLLRSILWVPLLLYEETDLLQFLLIAAVGDQTLFNGHFQCIWP